MVTAVTRQAQSFRINKKARIFEIAGVLIKCHKARINLVQFADKEH